MARRIAVSAFLLLLAATALSAAEQNLETPDYSREALRFTFRDYTYVPPPEPKLEMAVPGGRLSFSLNPLLALLPGPMGLESGSSVMPYVDPFSLLGVSFSQTPQTYAERSFARKLRRETSAWLRAQRGHSDSVR